MKRVELFFIQLFLLFMLGTICNSMAASAASIPVNEANFPDKDFRQYVLQQIDKNSDGMVSDEEIANTRKIVIDSNDKQGLTVGNFQGIELFTELEELHVLEIINPKGEDECAFGTNISLDLSKNTKLKTFVCKAGKIDGLSLSGLSLLEELHLEGYEYSVQDLSGITRLKRVYAKENVVLPDSMPEVTDLSVGKNVAVPEKMPKLRTLCLDSMDNPSIDFHRYPNLSELALNWVTVTELDLSNMTGLRSFRCVGSKLETLNFRGCSGLEVLNLSGLDGKCKNVYLDGCSNMRELGLYGQPISNQKSISEMTNLEYLNCLDCGLTELDLRNNEKLKEVDAGFNNLTDIKLSTKASYEKIYLDNNQLTKLDLRKIKVGTVTCRRNNLKKLLLSSKGNFKKIAVDYNFLTKVDIRKVKVSAFLCRNNMIRSLKVRKNKTIQKLDCRHNKLKTLDLRKCKKLKKLLWYSGTKGLKKSKIRRK